MCARTQNVTLQATCLNTLGNALGNAYQSRFDKVQSVADLSLAIKMKEMAVSVSPEDDNNRGMYLDNLAGAIERLSELEGSLDELDRAIKIIKQAVSSTPAHNANHITYVNSLGESLYSRFQK